ncbi:hypothetical protein R1flu_025276 [Riccia fluitans]|uniref:Uncharacterized protein n=1 Tax=Riccia fluitans TaxID=41844 RepID=A0ABD1XXB9_9MARC
MPTLADSGNVLRISTSRHALPLPLQHACLFSRLVSSRLLVSYGAALSRYGGVVHGLAMCFLFRSGIWINVNPYTTAIRCICLLFGSGLRRFRLLAVLWIKLHQRIWLCELVFEGVDVYRLSDCVDRARIKFREANRHERKATATGNIMAQTFQVRAVASRSIQ